MVYGKYTVFFHEFHFSILERGQDWPRIFVINGRLQSPHSPVTYAYGMPSVLKAKPSLACVINRNDAAFIVNTFFQNADGGFTR